MRLWSRPETEPATRLAVEGAPAENQPVPIAGSLGSDLATDVEFMTVHAPICIRAFLQPYLQHHRPLERDWRAARNSMDELRIDPLLKLDDRESLVAWFQSKRRRSIEDADNQLFSDMVGSSPSVQQRLYHFIQHLGNGLILISASFILHNLLPILRQLV